LTRSNNKHLFTKTKQNKTNDSINWQYLDVIILFQVDILYDHSNVAKKNKTKATRTSSSVDILLVEHSKPIREQLEYRKPIEKQ